MATTTTQRPRTQEQQEQQEQAATRLPGPPWYSAVRNTIRFLRDALGVSVEMRERYGDVVSVPTLVGTMTMIFHPDGVRHVLQENHQNYNKDIPDYRILSLLVGNGLLTNDGASWLQQRRLIQPAFHRERVSAFGPLMTDATQAWLDQREAEGFGDTNIPLDIPREMGALTLTIVCRALFGADLPQAEVERVGAALTSANHLLAQALYVPGLLTLPTPQRRRLRAARRVLRAVVDEIICQRRAEAQRGEQRDDLLALLLAARDEESGQGMSDQQARDEVLTLLLAGHETTANALSWLLYLLAQRPEVVKALKDEYRATLGGRAPALADLPRLPQTRMVVEEAMRLYPPAWAVGRNALGEDEIGGYRIHQGAYVILAQYVTQRHPAFWDDPDRFDPERFSDERSVGRHRYAYFPFGGGPRLCIGNQFAMMEAQLILATILARHELRLAPGAHVVPEPLITLRPGGALLMTLHRDDRQPAAPTQA
jgi:cytochrome P450